MPEVVVKSTGFRITSKTSATEDTTEESKPKRRKHALRGTMENNELEVSTMEPASEEAVINKPKKAKKRSILDATLRKIRNLKKGKDYIGIQANEIAQKVKKRYLRKEEQDQPGVVYLTHIPPGFEEEAMRDYFSQFGDVGRIKVGRSPKTGRIRGYAFIEFKYEIVAKIVAETMNNYILFNRLLKAEFIRHLKRDPSFWDKTTNERTVENRKRQIKGHNKRLHPLKERRRMRERLLRLEDMIDKLKKKGIGYSYKPAIRRAIPDSSTAGRYVLLKSPDVTNSESDQKKKEKTSGDSQKPVLEIDESDEDIVFNTPPNVIKRKLPICTPSSLTSKKGKSDKKTKKELNSKRKKSSAMKLPMTHEASAAAEAATAENENSSTGKMAVEKTSAAAEAATAENENSSTGIMAVEKTVRESKGRKKLKKGKGIKMGQIIKNSPTKRVARKLKQRLKKKNAKVNSNIAM